MNESLAQNKGHMTESGDLPEPDLQTPEIKALSDIPEDWNYEETVATIEAIITQIETGELAIADVFEQFETAINQLQQCETFLNYHQQKVDLLIETLNDDENSY